MLVKKLFITLFLVIVIIFVFIVLFIVSKKPNLLVSPLIAVGKPAVNLWLPKIDINYDKNELPEITAKAAYFVDVENGNVLYQKNPKERLPVASLTKIMTAIITLENQRFEDVIPVSQYAAGMEPDHMQLIAGERLTVEELLYGMFLVSANDAAEALAESSIGGRQEFIKQMNQKAKQLGMNNTLFINPTGLEEDGKTQYSTAYEVAIMSRYAIKNFPKLLNISSSEHIFLPQTSTHQDYDLYSGINLLTTYPGVLGFKTGYTPEAGLTLVTIAKKSDRLILGVLLNSENRREEARQLLDYSFKKMGI